jgi:tetratricopeptide (TPR) repeat protein
MFIKEMIFHKKYEELLKLIEESKDAAIEHINQSVFYLDIGNILTDFGFFNEGRDYYTKAMESNPSQLILATILTNIGTNYADQNKHIEAIPFYDQALQHNPENHATWSNKAMALLHKGDFKEAYECIKTSVDLYSQYTRIPNLDKKDADRFKNELYRLELKKEMVREFRDNLIKIGFIDRSDERGKTIVNILLTADKLLFRMSDKSLESFDYSMALVEYGKALESILHSAITIKAYDHCITVLGDKFNIYLSTDEFDELPRSLKPSMKNIDMSIFLGDWLYLRNNLAESNNPISLQFLEYIDNNFTKKEWDTIRNSAKDISRYRNGSAHKDIKNRNEVLKVRTYIVSRVNDVIDIIYKYNYK